VIADNRVGAHQFFAVRASDVSFRRRQLAACDDGRRLLAWQHGDNYQREEAEYGR
jgi:hypothetical protein